MALIFLNESTLPFHLLFPFYSPFLPPPTPLFPHPFSEAFAKHMITFEKFAEKPTLLSHPELVVKVKGRYYNWQVAGPLLMSILVFHRPLPQVRGLNGRG